MSKLVKNLWPVLIGITMFIGISYLVQTHISSLEPVLQTAGDARGMALFVLLGILTVVIPFGSLLPFIPVAVLLWNWQVTALLTLLSWALGGQILFEVSRALGKPVMKKIIPATQMNTIERMMEGRGLVHAILLRMFAHGDIVSYAFGLFSDVDRWQFLLITIIGVAPGAFIYAYFGSLSIAYQAGLAAAGLLTLVVYYAVDWEKTFRLKTLSFAKSIS